MKKIIFLTFFTLILLGFIWYILCMTGILCPTEKEKYVISILNIKESDSERILNAMMPNINLNQKEIEIEFISGNNSEPPINVKKPGGISKKDSYSKIVKDTLSFIFKKMLNQNKVNPNLVLQQTLKTLERGFNNEEGNKKYFIFGSFPECYKKEDFQKLLREIDNLNFLTDSTKSSESNKNTIFWCIDTNPEEIEYSLADELTQKGLNVIKQENIVSKRNCEPEINKQLICLILEPVPITKINDLKNYLKTNFKENVQITVEGNRQFSNLSFDLMNQNGNKFFELLPNADKATWKEVKSYFDNIILKVENQQNVVRENKNLTNLLILGKFPEAGKGDQKINWDKLKQIQVTWLLSNGTSINQITKDVIDGFNFFKIQNKLTYY